MDPMMFALGGASLLSSMFGQQQTNAMQAQMMQQQQSFQERMSNTAYQRASADMKAAGLNPMMMFSSGSAASTPAGAPASPNVKSGLDADAFQKTIGTAVQARVANATIDNLVEQNAKIKAETLTEKQRPYLVRGLGDTEQARQFLVARQADSELHRTERTKHEAESAKYDVPIVRNRALESTNQERINATARRLFDQGAYLGKRGADTIAPVTDVLNSAMRVKRAFEVLPSSRSRDYWETTVLPTGKKITRERIFND